MFLKIFKNNQARIVWGGKGQQDNSNDMTE